MFIPAMKTLFGLVAVAVFGALAGCSQFGDDNSAGAPPPPPPSAMGTMPNPPSFTPDPDSSAPRRQPVPGEDPGNF